MWEGEYKDWAKTAEAGLLSTVEADISWQAWLSDPAVKRDQDGPRGYLRLWVRKADYISQYEDMGRERILQRDAKLGKATSEAKLQAVADLVAYGGDGDNDSSADRQERVMQAVVGDGSKSALDGAAKCTLADLNTTTPRKRNWRRRTTRANPRRSNNRNRWIARRRSPTGEPDSSIEIAMNKAERALETKNRKTESALKEMLEKMDSSNTVNQNHSEKAKITGELAVLQRRTTWLRAVLSENDDLLKQAMETPRAVTTRPPPTGPRRRTSEAWPAQDLAQAGNSSSSSGNSTR